LGAILDAELRQTGLGHFDSTDWQPKIRHFFYVDTQQLAKALEFFKSSLAQRNLIPHAGISYRDADGKVWRTFYPGIEK
jgi:pyruvate dehydrogenase complex dehydrogenase (E1) component